MAATLVLLRHGQSEWNKQNLFTGWVDVHLSDEGKIEAAKASEALKNFRFDTVFTSALIRAVETAEIVVGKEALEKIRVVAAELNERRYGELEGKNKDEMRKIYGPDQVALWRRSFAIAPPGGESLAETCTRVVSYFEREIKPRLKAGQTILICAHGNSLRALVKHLEQISDEDICQLEIPTAVPMVFYLDDELNLVKKQVIKIHR
jgi:2,3-bisphosphoglycerate-dependent phosphoglycerate mutase